MTEKEYKDFKKALADAPEACTHHSNSSKRHFMIDGWRMHVWLGEVWSVPISNELDVLMVGDVRSLSDLRTMVEQYERIAQLELWIEYAVKHNPTFPEWIQVSASCVLTNRIRGAVK